MRETNQEICTHVKTEQTLSLDRLPWAEGPVLSLWNLATCERQFVHWDDGSSSAQVLFSSQVTYKKKNSCGEHAGDVRVIAQRDRITAQHLSQSLECVTATGSAEPFKSRGLIKSQRLKDGGFRPSDWIYDHRHLASDWMNQAESHSSRLLLGN